MIGSVTKAFVEALRGSQLIDENNVSVVLANDNGEGTVNTALPAVAIAIKGTEMDDVTGQYIGGLIQNEYIVQLAVIVPFYNQAASFDDNHQYDQMDLAYRVMMYIGACARGYIKTEGGTVIPLHYFDELRQKWEFSMLYSGTETEQTRGMEREMQVEVFVTRLIYRCKLVNKEQLTDQFLGYPLEAYKLHFEEDQSIPITAIEIAGPTTLQPNIETVYTVICTPSNNTEMGSVAVNNSPNLLVNSKTDIGHGRMEVRVTALEDGDAFLQAYIGSISTKKNITVASINKLRIVACFGFDYKTPTGGVYDPNGGYTKIRVISEALTGNLYSTDGDLAGEYQYEGSTVVPGTIFKGNPTGNDSGIYLDYAIVDMLNAQVNGFKLTLRNLASGTYRVKLYFNTKSSAYSANITNGTYTLNTPEAYDVRFQMPSDPNTWVDNYTTTVEQVSIVGNSHTMTISGMPDTNIIILQLVDLEKIT